MEFSGIIYERGVDAKAKDLASEITNFNMKKSNLQGEPPITSEHVKNNKDVRRLLAKSGIKPEELSAEEDVKKLVKRIKGPKKFKLDAVGFEASKMTTGKITFKEEV